MPMNTPPVDDERQGLLVFLDHQRQAVRHAAYGLTEEQARVTPTPSSLSLGGLVKHLVQVEHSWTDRVEGVRLPTGDRSSAYQEYMAGFSLADDETLEDMLVQYQHAAARTDAVMGAIDDVGGPVPLPAEPWYPERCTVRWVLLHLVEETARHAGHADIIREALDGAQSGPLMAAVEGWPDSGWVKPWRPS